MNQPTRTGADPRVRVLVADDEPFARFALRMLLEADPRICVVADASTGREAVQRTAEYHPDVVIMDLRMPEKDGGPIIDRAGITATKEIVRMRPQTRVLVHSSYDTDPLVAAAMRAGAAGYLRKADKREEQLAMLVLVVASGAAVFNWSNERMRHLFDTAYNAQRQSALPQLTPRERDVLNLAATAEEPSNRVIARKLGIGEGRVATYLSEAKVKLGAVDRKDLIAQARNAGLGIEL
ncbi:response regulator transcription factor [Streptomyces echinatus]|uniref:DNA-binding NarL/FixJ family response regulator n=1 Tax=Streptomyces echinatus TaxID=67293 RepID=A0A7W9Q2J0_9ACTN|nr:response regulator transcription factor [Streptomyces echinatus]MBB5932169.1 DNA-binding NarL/FixJ family response regulator [Streptomyces echinatus]